MKITILTFSSAFLPFFWPAFLSMGHQWLSHSPGLGSQLGGHTQWGWLCLPVVLHLLGRGVERDQWINHSLLVSLLVWQIRGVPITGCGVGFISFAREQGIASLVSLGRQWCTGEASCDTGSYLLRLLGISNFVFLIWKWMDAGSFPLAWGFL